MTLCLYDVQRPIHWSPACSEDIKDAFQSATGTVNSCKLSAGLDLFCSSYGLIWSGSGAYCSRIRWSKGFFDTDCDCASRCYYDLRLLLLRLLRPLLLLLLLLLPLLETLLLLLSYSCSYSYCHCHCRCHCHRHCHCCIRPLVHVLV